MTSQQQAAYTTLRQAKDETTWRAELLAFKASVDGPETDDIPLQALCMALAFVAEVASSNLVTNNPFAAPARELLGWQ
jgi:hypothetical protein